MINGKELEVVLNTRKEVLASNSGESLDVLLRLRAPVQELGEARTPLAVSLVIDRSGSMDGGKLDDEQALCSGLLSRVMMMMGLGSDYDDLVEVY